MTLEDTLAGQLFKIKKNPTKLYIRGEYCCLGNHNFYRCSPLFWNGSRFDLARGELLVVTTEIIPIRIKL